MSQETFEDLCNIDTFNKIIDNLSYYEAQGDIRAIEVFQNLRKQAIQKCGFVIRSLDKKLYNGHATKQKKITYRGFDKYEIDENGKLHVPDPPPPCPKIPDPIPECLIMLAHNEREAEKRRKEKGLK